MAHDSTGSGVSLSVIAWPILTGVPAVMAAWCAGVVLDHGRGSRLAGRG